MFFSMKEYRDVYNGGSLTFPQGMTVGLIAYAGMGLIVALSLTVFDLAIGGEFSTEYVNTTYQQLVENKEKFINAIGEEAYNNSLETTPNTTMVDLSSDYFLKTCALGILFTIIISVILRKQPN